jgi:iron complex transport system ATP-binding protein
VLVILHDLNLAARYADRLLMLKEGKLVASGQPVAVLTRQTIQETFAIPVIVTKHPHLDCPLVLPTRASRNDEG